MLRRQFATDGHFINRRLREAWDTHSELRAYYADDYRDFSRQAKQLAAVINEAEIARVQARAKVASVADRSISGATAQQRDREE